METLKKHKNRIYVLALLVLAFLLRFPTIAEHGLAGDEKYSLFVSQFVTPEGNNQHDSVRKPNDKYFTPTEFWSEKSTADFFDSIARLDTGNGALYTYFLHFWTELFGVSDLSLRLPSLLFNLLTISLLYIFTRRHFRSESLALIAVFLATISPFFIAFSQVARNYSMNMFFALLATHILLIIFEKEQKGEKQTWNYFFYGVCVLACEMCHFSTFPLFFIHGIFVLIYIRKIRVYIGLSLAMLLPLMGILAWLKSAGGQWVFDYIHHSVAVYNDMARHNPDDYLSLASPKNILRQIRHVVSAAFLLIDGFPSIFIKFKLIYACILLTFLGSLVLFIRKTSQISDKHQKYLRTLLLLFATLPLISLVFFAIQDGNTFRIIPRYIAYSYSFNLVLIALIINDLWQTKGIIKYSILAFFSVQILFVFLLNKNIWEDNPPRYFMSFSEPRKPNPYQEIAQKIEKSYMQGDTVIYPSIYFGKEYGVNLPQYSVVDAQFTNFYLPKNAKYIQRVEQNEPNKVFLKKKTGSTILLFDFEGTRFRY